MPLWIKPGGTGLQLRDGGSGLLGCDDNSGCCGEPVDACLIYSFATLDLADFTQVSGSWTNIGGSLETSSGSALILNNTTPSVSDLVISGSFQSQNGGAELRVVFAYEDSSNYYYAQLRTGSGGHMRIYRVHAGFEELISLSVTVNTGVSIAAPFSVCIQEQGVCFSLGATQTSAPFAEETIGQWGFATGSAAAGWCRFLSPEVWKVSDDCEQCTCLGPCDYCVDDQAAPRTLVEIEGLTKPDELIPGGTNQCGGGGADIPLGDCCDGVDLTTMCGRKLPALSSDCVWYGPGICNPLGFDPDDPVAGNEGTWEPYTAVTVGFNGSQYTLRVELFVIWHCHGVIEFHVAAPIVDFLYLSDDPINCCDGEYDVPRQTDPDPGIVKGFCFNCRPGSFPTTNWRFCSADAATCHVTFQGCVG